MTATRAALVVVVALSCAPARGRAQAAPRPAVFYILQRLATPRIDPARLPRAAREPYERAHALERTLAIAAQTLPRGETRDRRLRRLDARASDAWRRLRLALAARADALDGAGWALYGDALRRRAALDFVAQYEAAEADGYATRDLPEHPDFTAAIAIYRYAAAVSADPAEASWARYREALCLLDMGRWRDGTAALRTVASPRAAPEVASEARLRLGELAFDEGDLREASGWYARSIDGLPPEVRVIAIYKLAWARWLDGRHEDAREAIARLPARAPVEVRTELAELLVTRPP